MMIKINEKDTYNFLIYLMKTSDTLIIDSIHIKKIHNNTFPKPHFIYTYGTDIIIKDENWYTSNPDKIRLYNALKKLVRKRIINQILTQEINI
jgi:hypothetical protein